MTSHFADIEMAPRDPILGVTEQFNRDENPNKVNLGVGVYKDEQGKLPVLKCIEEAERRLIAVNAPKAYLPITGIASYNQHVQTLIFGKDSELLEHGRVTTSQALGGTGGLKLGADLLKMSYPASKVLISDPSWENHQALFTHAGFQVEKYRYYDQKNRGIDFDGMVEDLSNAPAKTIVVLHACCHNPTGYDLCDEQWDQILKIVANNDLIAFLDFAYQGFSAGTEQDAAVIRSFAKVLDSFLVSNSFSKSFSLYGERVGAINVVCANADEAAKVSSQLKIVARTNFSNPPTHGAALVNTVLSDESLTMSWQHELGQMRDRIKQMRSLLVDGLNSYGINDMSYIKDQVGMFSYSGLTSSAMQILRNDYSVYGTDAGRLCMAALNHNNVEYVAQAISAVLTRKN